MNCNSKMAGRRANWTLNLGLTDTSNIYMVYILPYSVNGGHCGVIQWTCLKIASVSKTAARRANLGTQEHYYNTLEYLSLCLECQHIVYIILSYTS